MKEDNYSTSFKEKAKIFWMVKGHLPDPKTIENAYPGYFKRLWHNEEAYVKVDGFEEAYQKKFGSNQN